MRTAGLLLALFCGTAALAAPVPKLKKPVSPEERLLGKWRLVANRGVAVPNSGFHIVFLKGGQLEFRSGRPGGPQSVATGTYTLGPPDEENKYGTLDWTVTQGGQVRAERDRFTEWADDVFEIVDPAGVTQRYERVKEK